MEHLQELRYRVMVSAVAVVVGLSVSAVFANRIIDFLEQPAKDRAPADFQFQFIEPFENFVTYFRVALLGGLILAMPVIVYQVLRFVAPGLRAASGAGCTARWSARRGSSVAGVAFSYYVALPPALNFLLNFNNGPGAAQHPRIGSYIDFVTRLLFWTGVCFGDAAGGDVPGASLRDRQRAAQLREVVALRRRADRVRDRRRRDASPIDPVTHVPGRGADRCGLYCAGASGLSLHARRGRAGP